MPVDDVNFWIWYRLYQKLKGEQEYFVEVDIQYLENLPIKNLPFKPCENWKSWKTCSYLHDKTEHVFQIRNWNSVKKAT